MVSEDTRRLIDALLLMDEALPHCSPLPDDAPRPRWCRLFTDHFGIKEGECCGICPELSEITVAALNKAFHEK